MKQFLFIAISLISIHFGSSQNLDLSKTIKNDSLYLNLINPFFVYIEINLSALDSTKSFIKVNPYGILNEKDTLKNALVIPLLKVKDTTRVDFSDYVKYKAQFGNPNEDYNNNYEYEFPFQKGKRYKIIQSFGGKFSHNKPHSKYAIDFGLAIGDTITAARKGRVYFVKEDSKEHCRTPKCIDKANKIYVIHDDSTMAHYVHLDFEGALVKVGDTIEVNQPIGISGMTGFTTIPHLHFVLYKSRSVSIPYQFRGVSHKPLKQGRYYQRKD